MVTKWDTEHLQEPSLRARPSPRPEPAAAGTQARGPRPPSQARAGGSAPPPPSAAPEVPGRPAATLRASPPPPRPGALRLVGRGGRSGPGSGRRARRGPCGAGAAGLRAAAMSLVAEAFVSQIAGSARGLGLRWRGGGAGSPSAFCGVRCRAQGWGYRAEERAEGRRLAKVTPQGLSRRLPSRGRTWASSRWAARAWGAWRRPWGGGVATGPGTPRLPSARARGASVVGSEV